MAAKKLNLNYFKPKYFNFKVAENYKLCEKRHKCDFGKTPYEHFSLFSKTQKCDTCIYRAIICLYVHKKYYTICYLKKKKFMNFEKLPPK